MATLDEMIKEKSWDEFRTTGLVVFINQILHIFGWAIVFEVEKGKVTNCYPARVKFRGFDEESTDDAYMRITEYMHQNAKELQKDIEEPVKVGNQ